MQAPPSHRSGFLSTIRFLAATLTLCTAIGASAREENPFADFVRKTDPRTPTEEQKSFHLPPGFEIQLVASEPDIDKPMNMAFDEHGRLWITQSREYPYPAPSNAPARDAIKILSDFDQSGRARNITTFADGLNIPIGFYPYRNGAIGFSIPGIYTFEDQDRDGKSDKRTMLYAGQGFDRDTHGLTSAFRRGYDGWIYACHGYNNNTTLRGTDGHTISMNSGNLYRFKPDGSRVEQWTWGQVNPFGMMFDSLGDLFTADCHSSPVYMALRGAYYPSFGKPHDGLGYGPEICTHSHGSTAICGLTIYDADAFPAEYRGNSFIGNVMSCRINRDSFVEHGSTRIAKEKPDFLRSDDPWFRPVDVQLGPDGALYVADFYNRIIGHYEVPLDHPGRDRTSGRIWRIVYRGDGGKKLPLPQDFDISQASASKLVTQLASANVSQRMRATDQLSDRVALAAVRPVEKMLADKKSTAEQKAHGLWVLYRLGKLPAKALAAAARDNDRLVRVHVMRVLSETADWTAAHRALALAGLHDADAYVQRAAADALGCHPEPANIRFLLDARHRAPAEDAQLVHTVRMALRNQLQTENGYASLAGANVSEADARALADVSLGVKSEGAGSFLLNHIQKVSEPRGKMIDFLRHAGRYAPEKDLAALGEIVRLKFPNDADAQYTAYKSVQEGFAQRGGGLSDGLRAWAARLTEQLLSSQTEPTSSWRTLPVKGLENSENPWSLEQRKSADGDKKSVFLSSRLDETATGACESPAFTIPAKFSFFLAGHDGEPDQPPVKKDYIRLLDAATREPLIKAVPPRNDEAQRITWDLGKFAGKQGILEIVDGHDDDGYAWLAIGRFNPAVITLPDFIPNSVSQRQRSAADLTRTVPLPQFEPQMKQLFASRISTPSARAAAAHALLALNQKNYLRLFAASVADTNQTPALRENLAFILADLNVDAAREAAIGALLAAPRRVQTVLAQSIGRYAEGADQLITLAEQKRLPVSVLTYRPVKDRLVAAKLPGFKERFDKLTQNLPSADKDLQRLIEKRRLGYEAETASATRGNEIFTKNCAVCHQIDGKGAVVGPQLDGAGSRGLERLIEDVLDSNRNVDPAFRTSNLTLKDDTAITGLLRREEGEVLVFADSTGKEISVPKKEIAERRESQLSLMPANFGDIIPVADFNDLMAFLLAHGAK